MKTLKSQLAFQNSLICDGEFFHVDQSLCFKKVDHLCWEQKVGKIKEKLYMLFSKYSSKTSTSNVVKCNLSDALSSSSMKPNLFYSSYLLSSNLLIIIIQSPYLDKPTLDIYFSIAIDSLMVEE